MIRVERTFRRKKRCSTDVSDRFSYILRRIEQCYELNLRIIAF
jgi:hypothetical protein